MLYGEREDEIGDHPCSEKITSPPHSWYFKIHFAMYEWQSLRLSRFDSFNNASGQFLNRSGETSFNTLSCFKHMIFWAIEYLRVLSQTIFMVLLHIEAQPAICCVLPLVEYSEQKGP